MPQYYIEQKQGYNSATGNFFLAGSVAWNSLPLDIRSAPTLSAFKNMLKTHLFSRSYFTDCFQSTSSEHCTVPL